MISFSCGDEATLYAKPYLIFHTKLSLKNKEIWLSYQEAENAVVNSPCRFALCHVPSSNWSLYTLIFKQL